VASTLFSTIGNKAIKAGATVLDDKTQQLKGNIENYINEYFEDTYPSAILSPISKISTLSTNGSIPLEYDFENKLLYDNDNLELSKYSNDILKIKSYGNKKKSYEESNSKVTRDIAEKYETLEEKNIIERSKFIVSELNKYTNYKIGRCIGGIDLYTTKLEIKDASLIIGTLGRIHHMITDKVINVHTLKLLVMDEADEMLTDGVSEKLEFIFEKMSAGIQTILISATMNPNVFSVSKKLF
jgi:hypothetical protein